jgi:hypothetical protein
VAGRDKTPGGEVIPGPERRNDVDAGLRGQGLPPPAPVGNLRAATHAAFSDRIVMPDADLLADAVFAENWHLADQDALAVRDYAIAQVRAWRLAAWLERNGDFDKRGRPRPALEQLRRWLERAERARSRLGLDPLSRAALHVDQSLVLARTRQWAADDLAEGRRLREAAQSRGELRIGNHEAT